MNEGGWWEISGQRASLFPLGGRPGDQQDDSQARAALDEAFSAPSDPSSTVNPFVAVQFDTDSARWVVDHWSARDQTTERSFARLDAALTAARKTGALLILGSGWRATQPRLAHSGADRRAEGPGASVTGQS